MKWIKCSERLPSPREPVLFHSGREYVHAGYYDDEDNRTEGVWIEGEPDPHAWPIQVVTHWMPLPEPREDSEHIADERNRKLICKHNIELNDCKECWLLSVDKE